MASDDDDDDGVRAQPEPVGVVAAPATAPDAAQTLSWIVDTRARTADTG